MGSALKREFKVGDEVATQISSALETISEKEDRV